MNVTLCRTTDADLELDNLISLDEDYKTAPIFVITPIPQQLDEEELHKQFEKALHKRANASNSRLKSVLKLIRSSVSLSHKNQRILIYCCSALSCILLGFDLMGLLVLHMR